jgi:hypothetical protein
MRCLYPLSPPIEIHGFRFSPYFAIHGRGCVPKSSPVTVRRRPDDFPDDGCAITFYDAIERRAFLMFRPALVIRLNVSEVAGDLSRIRGIACPLAHVVKYIGLACRLQDRDVAHRADDANDEVPSPAKGGQEASSDAKQCVLSRHQSPRSGGRYSTRKSGNGMSNPTKSPAVAPSHSAALRVSGRAKLLSAPASKPAVNANRNRGLRTGNHPCPV